MTLEATPAKPTSTVQTAHALDPNARLAWGRDCDVFALRLRDQPPEPPKRLFEFLDSPNSARLSHTTRKVVDGLLTGDLARTRSETLADSLRISPTTLRRRLSRDGLNYQTILDLGETVSLRRVLGGSMGTGQVSCLGLGLCRGQRFLSRLSSMEREKLQ